MNDFKNKGEASWGLWISKGISEIISQTQEVFKWAKREVGYLIDPNTRPFTVTRRVRDNKIWCDINACESNWLEINGDVLFSSKPNN